MRHCQKVLFVLLPALSAGWNWNPEDEHPCTVPRQMTFWQMTQRFGPQGVPPLFPHPLLLRANASVRQERNDKFANLTDRHSLVEFFGNDFSVTLTSSNSLSENRRTIRLEQYLDEIETQHQVTPDLLSNETWYLFGETFSDDWQKLLEHYEKPPCVTCETHPVALAFGIGNQGSGVQWHTHGPGFSETIHGRKHWILYPKTTERPPHFHKDQSSRQWMESVYSALEPAERPMECTLYPGDLLYFPDEWWHATINLDPYTVFVSSFTTEHGLPDDRRQQDEL